MTIETEDLPPIIPPEEMMKLADSYASINFFDGMSGNPLHGQQSQFKRAELKVQLDRVYEEIDHMNMALRAEAQNGDEQAAKAVELRNAMTIVVEECRGLKEMNDLMAMNAEYLCQLLERSADVLMFYLASHSDASLENLYSDLTKAVGSKENTDGRG